MYLVLELGVHRVCSWETKTDITWNKQEQAGTRRMNWHLHVISQSPALMMCISWGKVALCQISKFWCLVPGIREAEGGPKERWHIVSQTAAPHQQVEPASQLQHVRAAEVSAWKKKWRLLYVCPPNLTLKCILWTTLPGSLPGREFWETVQPSQVDTRTNHWYKQKRRWILKVLC